MKEIEMIDLISLLMDVEKSEIKILEKTKGMSNHTYIFQVSDGKFTLRIPGLGDHLFVKRSSELKILEQVPTTLTSETVIAQAESGYKISKFLEGSDLASTPAEEISFEKVAELFKQVHSLKITCEDYNPQTRLALYESHNKKLSKEYYDSKAKWEQMHSEIASEKLVFCHCDSQMSNIIKTNEQYKIIDFEFAGNNEIEYDIAAFGNTDFQMALKLAEYYFGEQLTKLHIKRIYLWRIFQCLQWHNVALKKDELGLGNELGIDFKMVSDKYVALANTLMEEYNKIGE